MVTAEELYQKLAPVKIVGGSCSMNLSKCQDIIPLVNEINTLKQQQNAIILAHSYISPEISLSVADFTGDSYELSKKAQVTSAQKIIFVAVRFMAETAKILNPDKQVLIPSRLNGCSLADSITAKKVVQLRQQFPDHTFICYINTTAEVKAQCDVCVTSSNVYDIIEHYPNNKIFFLPDKLMGLNIKEEMKLRGVDKQIDIYDGTCYVHEEYDPEMIDFIRLKYPEAKVLSHPECSPQVVQKSDFVGSTSQMINFVQSTQEDAYFVLSECGLAEKLQVTTPNKKFVGSCTQCKYMKANSLSDILIALKSPQPYQVIDLDNEIRKDALKCIEQMFHYADKFYVK